MKHTASLLEDPWYIHSAGLEKILDPRTTCLLGLCIGNSTMGCLNDLYTWVKKGKQSHVSRHNHVLGKGASDLCVPSCVYQMYTSRWTFAFPFCDLQQISRLVSVEGKEIARNCCCTATVVTRREGLQMRGFCRSLHQQKVECLWEGCRVRQHGVSCIMSDKKALKELATGMDTCTCQRGKFTKSPMLCNGTFSFGSNGPLDWPEPQLLRNSRPRTESRARRQISPPLLAYKLSLSIWLTKNKDIILWEDMQNISHLQRHV